MLRRLCTGAFLIMATLISTSCTTSNPLLEEWDTRFDVPPFAEIEPAHFLPAFRAAMEEQKVEVAAIVASEEAPSFENTVEALERSGQTLTRVASIFYALDSAHTNDAIREVARTVAPELAAHGDDILLDRDLYERVDAVFQQLKASGRLDAYRLDWQPDSEQPQPHVFWDSDVAKWVEGACYSLINQSDQALQRKVDHVVDQILSAQGEDGYLNPHFTVVSPQERWTNLRDKHELYCAGHLIEAAIAHHRATGDQRFLDAMRRYADLIGRVFGAGEGQKRGYPGHEELELALVKLYRHTGKKKYLDLAAYFIEERGQQPHYFDIEARQRGEDPQTYWAKTHAYTQSHLPVRQQQTVVGHAVRAMYLYSGIADLARETGDTSLLETLQNLWLDLTRHKLYLTGGIGPSRENEGFTGNYDLPNQAYAETCAAIGLVFWTQRMLQIDLDSRYADVLEKALYNGFLSGVSLSGDRFFYENPLASEGDHHRQPFYACSCCPPNVNRLLPALGEYLYSIGPGELDVHLYVQSRAEMVLDGTPLTVVQQTDYPWDGIVCLGFEMEGPRTFTLKLRWPGWCREGWLYLNGEPLSTAGKMVCGYVVISREWQPGDRLRLQWSMPAGLVYPHPQITADLGRAALMRGPLVYCLEGVDLLAPLDRLFLQGGAAFDSEFHPDVLGGVVVVTGTGYVMDAADWGDALYRQHPPEFRPAAIHAVPYFTWDNRGAGKMRVWLPLVPERA